MGKAEVLAGRLCAKTMRALGASTTAQLAVLSGQVMVAFVLEFGQLCAAVALALRYCNCQPEMSMSASLALNSSTNSWVASLLPPVCSSAISMEGETG